MREQKKNIKECDTRFLKVEEHPPMKGDIIKTRWIATKSIEFATIITTIDIRGSTCQ
jgi:hypothetical protein